MVSCYVITVEQFETNRYRMVSAMLVGTREYEVQICDTSATVDDLVYVLENRTIPNVHFTVVVMPYDFAYKLEDARLDHFLECFRFRFYNENDKQRMIDTCFDKAADFTYDGKMDQGSIAFNMHWAFRTWIDDFPGKYGVTLEHLPMIVTTCKLPNDDKFLLMSVQLVTTTSCHTYRVYGVDVIDSINDIPLVVSEHIVKMRKVDKFSSFRCYCTLGGLDQKACDANLEKIKRTLELSNYSKNLRFLGIGTGSTKTPHDLETGAKYIKGDWFTKLSFDSIEKDKSMCEMIEKHLTSQCQLFYTL